jgi:hypothetical protein
MSTELERFASVKNMSKNELIAMGVTDAQAMIEEGKEDLVGLAVSARKAIEYLGAFLKSMDSPVTDAIYNNGSKEILKVLGSELTLGSTGDRYDYGKDATYANLALAIKARADLLKSASLSDVEIVDSNGEIVKKVPIKTPARETIKFKL